MQIELYDTGTLERLFFNRPDILEELRTNRIVEPWHETPDHAMRVIPGDRKDLLALPGSSLDGKADDAFYIDLAVDTEEGAAYVGAQMFRDLANLVGYCDVAELKAAYQRIEELEKEVDSLTTLTHRLRLVRDDLRDLEVVTATGPKATSGRGPKATPADAA